MDERYRLSNQPRIYFTKGNESELRMIENTATIPEPKSASNFLHCAYTPGNAFINAINNQN